MPSEEQDRKKGVTRQHFERERCHGLLCWEDFLAQHHVNGPLSSVSPALIESDGTATTLPVFTLDSLRCVSS